MYAFLEWMHCAVAWQSLITHTYILNCSNFIYYYHLCISNPYHQTSVPFCCILLCKSLKQHSSKCSSNAPSGGCKSDLCWFVLSSLYLTINKTENNWTSQCYFTVCLYPNLLPSLFMKHASFLFYVVCVAINQFFRIICLQPEGYWWAELSKLNIKWLIIDLLCVVL